MAGTKGRFGKRARLASGVALGLILLAPGALGAWVAKTGPRRLKHCWSYMRRIEQGRGSGYNVTQLAREGRGLGFVERFLEAQARDPKGEHRRAAVEALFYEFPESETARTVAEFEAISNDSYFKRGESHVIGPHLTPPERIQRWRTFVSENPDFHGRNRAAYELARCEEETGDAVGAFLTLSEALELFGDLPYEDHIASRLTNVMDAQLSLEDAVALADRSTDLRFRPLLRYTAAVKLAQARRFGDAVARLDAFAAEVGGGADVALLAATPRYFVWRGANGKPQVRTPAFLADVAEQRALWAHLASLEVRADAAPGTRAIALRRMGDALMGEPHAFENLVLHDHVVTDCSGERPWKNAARHDERFESYATERNHLAQAATLYETAAREGVPGRERTRALAGAASARLGLLGFWSERQGHAVPQDWDARVDAAARSVALALAAGAGDGSRLAVELELAAAWTGMVREVRDAVRQGRDRSPWPVASEYQVARQLRIRAGAFWRQPIEKPALALGRKQGE